MEVCLVVVRLDWQLNVATGEEAFLAWGPLVQGKHCRV